MKINVIKKHSLPLGEAEVSELRGRYLIRVGVAKDANSKTAPKKSASTAKKQK